MILITKQESVENQQGNGRYEKIYLNFPLRIMYENRNELGEEIPEETLLEELELLESLGVIKSKEYHSDE
jgi:hypothetical protein